MKQLDINDVKDVNDVKYVLQKLKDILQKDNRQEFNSHEFICRYRRFYEKEYINMLNNYEKNAFQEVNKQIGSFLERNQKKLGIRYVKKVKDRNDHFESSDVVEWEIL